MVKENQHIEWKESWRDEYLKWIAAFANTNGGELHIGVNDKGKIVAKQYCRLNKQYCLLPQKCILACFERLKYGDYMLSNN